MISIWVLIQCVRAQINVVRNGIALIMQTNGPTASTMKRKSLDFVTSTLTARFVFFLSIVSKRSFAAGFK